MPNKGGFRLPMIEFLLNGSHVPIFQVEAIDSDNLGRLWLEVQFV